GAPIASTTTDADGTFALDSAVTPVAVRIACAYCRAKTVTVASNEPIVAVIERYDAVLQPGVSAADLAALPYGRIENALALQPFWVLRTQPPIAAALYPALSDRGLGRGSLVVDGGAPAYDFGSSTMTGLAVVPAHAGDDVRFVPSSQAYRYGTYGSGGAVEFSRDQTILEQAAYGDAGSLRFSAGTPQAGITLGTDADDVAQRSRLSASAQQGLAGGVVSAGITAARATFATPEVDTSQSTASIAYARSFDRVQLRLDAADAFGTSSIPLVPSLDNVWNNALLRGTLGTRIGIVDVDGSASYVNSLAQQPSGSVHYNQRNFTLEGHLPGPTAVDAAVAQTYITIYDGRNLDVTLPSLLVSQRLGAFGVGIGFSRSLLATYGEPEFVPATLAEAHLDYGDGHRLRGELQAYRRTSDTQAPLAGTGISVAYQVTPTTTLRAWTLRVWGDMLQFAGPAVVAQAYVSGDTLWLTHQNGGFRLDAIYRRASDGLQNRRGLDGDVYFPVTRRLAVGLRSELAPEGRRSSVVLSVRP
ncbi:MAG: hypothetical protein ACREMT_05460, partial [Vulcanimicrobiaceae bacterium]